LGDASVVSSATYVGNHVVGEWQGTDINQIELRNNGFLNAFIGTLRVANLQHDALYRGRSKARSFESDDYQ
jgi:hypothetical protein